MLTLSLFRFDQSEKRTVSLYTHEIPSGHQSKLYVAQLVQNSLKVPKISLFLQSDTRRKAGRYDGPLLTVTKTIVLRLKEWIFDGSTIQPFQIAGTGS